MARMRHWFLTFLTVSVALTLGARPVSAQRGARNQLPAAAASTPTEPFRTAADRPFDIQDLRLDLKIDLPKKSVDGTATLQVRSLRPIKSIGLDAAGFSVSKVSLTAGNRPSAAARFGHDGKKLVVFLDPPWPTGQKGTLQVDYRIHEPTDGLHFFAPSAADPDVPLLVWSQGQPSSNRFWFPCVDEPDQRQSTELVVTVPQGFEVLSNGKLIDRKEHAADKTVTFDWRQELAHPAYLVTLVVGQFDVVREDWDRVPVFYYVPKGRTSEVAATFGRTRAMLTYFSKRFGIQYPWEKYAQVVAYRFGGGMENTSATTLGEILIDEKSAIDRTPDDLIAHEMAHQWWGDMVTCRDWAHVWLNEGFASFAEALWEENSEGQDGYSYNMYQKSARAIAAGKNRPVVDRRYANADSMFDGRAYPKGAWILHMLRRRLGDEAFWKAVQRYGADHRLQSAETADFRRTLERETGRDLERFFYDWTERPGSPNLEIATDYLPATQQARMVVKQTQAGEPFHFPLALVFHCAGNEKPTVVETEVVDKETTVLVPLSGPLTQVDVDPDQAVLAEIEETKSRDLWEAQLLRAPDVAARIRAARHFGKSKAEEDRELLAKAFAAEKFWGADVEIAAALAASGGDSSRDALIRASHHANARVRRACIDDLGKFKPDPAIATTVAEILHTGDASYAVQGAAMAVYAKQGRKDAVAVLTPWLSKPSHDDVLRGSALAALGNTSDPAALETLLEWAQSGHPRNARNGALRGLTQALKQSKPNAEQTQRIFKTLTEALEGNTSPTRFAVIAALMDLGPAAAPALPALDKLIANETNERFRGFAKRAADSIRSSSGAATAPTSPELKQLREEVARLKKDQAAWRERLSKYEKAGGGN